MTQIHPGINIGLQQIRNTSEYITKLQLHQHSLLTRKVFSRHNLSAQVFFLVSSRSSSRPRHLQVIFIWIQIITRSGSSSLDLDHHSIWIIIIRPGSSLDLDHHFWIYIITRSRSSSLDLDHHHWIQIITQFGSSSLDLDHHRIWIITGSGSSLDLDHHCWIIINGPRSSLDLYHHQISIIT